MQINLLRQCFVDLVQNSEDFLAELLDYARLIESNKGITNFIPSPELLKTYLVNTNWVIDHKSEFWHSYTLSKEFVEVPQIQDADDYTREVCHLIYNLALIEDRRCIEILFDLYGLSKYEGSSGKH